MRGSSLAVLFLLAAGGCGDDGIRLVVDVRTDLVPAVDFTGIVTQLESGSGPAGSSTVLADPSADYIAGQRVAELTGLASGAYTVRVTLRDARTDEVVSRRVRLQLDGDFGLVLLLTRSCRGVECPGSSDAPTDTECRGGRCVDPSCVGPECAVPGCIAESDCTAALASCAVGRCIDEVCLVAPVPGACAGGQLCDPEVGCIDVTMDGGVDGGAGRDAGADSGSDSGFDGGPPGDACVPVAETCNGLDDDCSGTIDDGPGFTCRMGDPPMACLTTCMTNGVTMCGPTCTQTPCTAANETCNGCDDDGDTRIDEGAPCSCPGGPDVRDGGSFPFNTCAETNRFDLGCNAAGTPEFLIHVRQGLGGSYSYDPGPGFIVSHFSNDVDACMSAIFASPSCGPTLNHGFSTVIGPWMAIERSGGGCGSGTVVVTRR